MGSFGETLRQARLDKGVSLAEAEKETCIRLRYLQALENEDFSVLPAAVYARGMIRSYARYLGLSPESMVDLFQSNRPREERTVFRAASLHSPVQHRIRFGSVGIILAAIGVVLFLLLAWGQYASISDSLRQLDAAEAGSLESTPAPSRSPTALPVVAKSDAPILPTRQPTPTLQPTITPTPIAGILVEARVVAATFMEVWVDDQKVLEESVAAGAVHPFQGERTVVLRVADGTAVEITENGSPRGILDTSGRAVEARWTRG